MYFKFGTYRKMPVTTTTPPPLPGMHDSPVLLFCLYKQVVHKRTCTTSINLRPNAKKKIISTHHIAKKKRFKATYCTHTQKKFNATNCSTVWHNMFYTFRHLGAQSKMLQHLATV